MVQELPGHTRALIGFIEARAASIEEGFVNVPQLAYFKELVRNSPNITYIVEVGFNAGVSAENFLFARPDVCVVSFDLGVHACVSIGKSYIDWTYPGRHELVLGDSRYTVPRYRESYPNKRFDLIFLDGGHSFEEALCDIINMRFMAAEYARVVMDDLTPWQPWGMGPCKAWDHAVKGGVLTQIRQLRDGLPAHTRCGMGDERVWAVGRYFRLTAARKNSG